MTTTSHSVTDRRLLTCGLLAGPMLIGVGLVQVLTRDGFDLDRHALSQLSLGRWGFVQIINFLVTGVLVIAAARGLRGVPGMVWGSRLLAGFGAGMLIAGVFPADPAYGFPAGTPDELGPLSWHGVLHSAGFMVAMVSWAAAMIVLARAFIRRGDRGQAAVCGVALVTAAGVIMAPALGSFGLRAIVVSAVQLAAVALLCAKALASHR
ncbi:DUF998 domain-containing protein [Actinoplanes sp. NPDC051494]|uniref:DUF998 domain-containing protein n=1 Tax=Actinoplanes sp. NPDC051494 TaxID=3363907 RepID=UPI003791773D